MSNLSQRIADLPPEQRALLEQRLKQGEALNTFQLSFAQERLWFLDQLEPGSAFYTIPTMVRLRGPLDAPALQAALGQLAQRHESLRTTFATIEGRPVQVVAPTPALSLAEHDLRDLPAPTRMAAAQQLAEAIIQQPFELARGPLLRAALLRLADDDQLLLLALHHTIGDGWSLGVLVRELVACYRASAAGQPAELPALPLQYADYAAWQRKRLQGALLERQLAYWRAQLAEAPPLLVLPTDRPRPPVLTTHGALHALALPRPLAAALTALGQREGSTLFMVLLAGFQALLARWSGQTDLLVGSPIAGRTRPELEGLIGCFVNTLVLRANLADNPSFRTLIGRVRDTTLGAFAHQDLPFERLVEALQPTRDLRYAPVFQVMFVLQNAPQPMLEIGGLRVEPVALPSQTARFDLTLTLGETAEGLAGLFEYNTDLFDATTIARLAEYFQTLLAGAVAAPDRALADLPLLSAAERTRQLVEWNAGTPAGAPTLPFQRLFEQQAARDPAALALVAGDQQLSYAALNARANQLAHHLRTLGIGPEARVALGLARSPELVLAMLAVLKAGGAFLPLDMAYPAERLAAMLADAQVAAVISTTGLAEQLPAPGAPLVLLDRDTAQIAAQSAANPPDLAAPEHAAYLIYTSGSTGRPKGVLLTHRGLSNLAAAQAHAFGVRPGEQTLQFASPSFDAAIFEIVLALQAGATLCLGLGAALIDGAALARLLREQAISCATLTPTVLALLPDTPLPALRTLIVAGEDCPAELAARWAAGRRFLNAYGPTEATVWATLAEYTAGHPPIGRPIANTQAYLLDRHMQLVPAGTPAELYLGGAGLARGYLHRPDLTAERFVPDPFGTTPGARLYRTGDMARYRPDGQIEFLGRADQQVKLRGMRIELGEIAATLRQHAAVREAAVLLRDYAPGDQRLVAYVVPAEQAPDHTPTLPAGLRAFLKQRLPEYMLPAALVPLAALPQTPGGKLDQRALPVPLAQPQPAAPGALQGQLEHTIAAIWQSLLGVAAVGRDDNFFDLGGHSLLIVQVQHQLNAALGREIAIVELFRYPTVGTLAQFLAGAAGDGAPDAGQARASARRGRPAPHDQAVAIIGMSARFPGAPDIASFWQNLRDGVESISFFSEHELLDAGVSPALLAQPNYVRASGVIDGADLFDAAFFGYSPREAEIMDPQQRVFLECAWAALEDAGYPPDATPVPTGVYGGVSLNRYWLNLAGNPAISETMGGFHTVMSNDRDFLTTRVSYKLNLRGPSVNIQSACSTSLVAVHSACQALLHHECDMALAGGVSVAAPAKTGYTYHEGGIAAPDGHCRAFDAQARGTVYGSGVGLVVLKRLADALADHDQIYAVIKGSASNNDGARKVGYTAPSVEGQAEVIAEALALADLSPASIGYVEAHGTGTPLGDPIEVAALNQAFRASALPAGACALGSVKSNVGHLDAAAGIAGLIKATLALKHAQIPPSLHFSQPNPQIDFAAGPFYVNAQLAAWPTTGQPRRAGVSSFGIGGTNAHVVLEQAPEQAPEPPGQPWQLVLLSAKTAPALDAAAANMAAYLRHNPGANLADLAYTLQVGRSRFSHRRAVLCRTTDEAAGALEAGDPQLVFDEQQPARDRPVVFMFPGGGGQHVRMAHELYAAEPVFRAQVDACAELLAPHLGCDLRAVLFATPEQADAAAQQLAQTALALPALFTVCYALAQLWQSWGLRPAALIGHSLGEYVAACLAGVFRLPDALALVATRGRLMQALPPGRMLSVALPEAAVRARLGHGLDLAAVNGPALCVVSGPAQALAAFEQALRAEQIECQPVPIDVAAHSAMVDPILAEFGACVRGMPLQPPQIACISGVSGTWLTDAEATDPAYWVRHLRQTVRFADGVAELLREPARVLLEVGPGRALSAMARLQAGDDPAVTTLASLPSRHDRQPELAVLYGALARLWLAGAAIDWPAVHAHAPRRRVSLPTYPFERWRFWIDPQPAARPAAAPRLDPQDWLHAPSWTRALPLRRLAPAELAQQPRRWLLLLDEAGLGEQLALRLAQAGHTVLTAQPGLQFAQLAPGRYTLDPAQPEGYDTLLGALQLAGQLPEIILHLWAMQPASPPYDSFERFERAQERGLYSLLRLAQALGSLELAAPIRLGVIADRLYAVTGSEPIAPEQATLLAACKVIPQEYPQITCRSLDVRVSPAELRPDAIVLDQIIAELVAEDGSDTLAYRGPHRWRPAFEPIRAAPAAEPRLRQQGVYMITGGMGGIGALLAGFLARQAQARLVLVGRRAPPPRAEWPAWLAAHPADDPISARIELVYALEAHGAEVLALAADVADLAQMRAVVAQAQARFGPLHGVIHAAGVPGGGMIQLRTPAEVAASLAPKARGTLVLDALVRDMPLDFLVLFSSLNALLGGFGQADYCAANLFLDAFAQARSGAAGPEVLSINWSLWRGVGMATLGGLAGALGDTVQPERAGMAPEQALQVFDRILRLGRLPQVVVSLLPPEALLEQSRQLTRAAIEQALAQAPAAPAVARHPRRNLPTAYVAPRTDTERRIAELWEQLLGVTPIGINDNFFDLGGHSLLAIQLVGQLRAEFQADVSLHGLFETPTVAQVAAGITAGPAPGAQAETLEAMLQMVEGLSDDEVAALLLGSSPEGDTTP
ncbi:MAG: amino acid adenylation domain-containing protein [Kouleothrix sp.]|jgi:amino acid adenylation domain-containing protein|nr:amino acid adenylation domain-containing protein [Kouleothrix sp.]